MIKSVRDTRFFKSFWFILALYMLNISVDAPANDVFNANLNSNDNVQDSIIEICLEVWLGFEQAIPDLQESDDDYDLTLKKPWFKNLYIVPANYDKPILTFTSKFKNRFLETQTFLLKNYLEVHSPPPDGLFSILC
jgi:hypothetical protein